MTAFGVHESLRFAPHPPCRAPSPRYDGEKETSCSLNDLPLPACRERAGVRGKPANWRVLWTAFSRPILPFAAALLFTSPALAEHFEVKMLNRGEKGPMVFEPDYLQLTPGDTVKFIATNQSHNAATIDGMVPEGHPGFKGKINEEITVTFDRQGFYGIKCSPHYGMGMVMLIKVGEAALPDAYRSINFPSRARPRFDELFAAVDAAATGK